MCESGKASTGASEDLSSDPLSLPVRAGLRQAHHYTILLKRDGDGYVLAAVKEFDGCLAHGADVVEALSNIESARLAWLEAVQEAGQTIPPPDPDEQFPLRALGLWLGDRQTSMLSGIGRPVLESARSSDAKSLSLPVRSEAERAGEERREAMTFRKKPVVIEAVQYAGGGNMEPRGGLPDWLWAALANGTARFINGGDPLLLKTLEGELMVSPGDWIIQGVKGELYPCKPDIFAATYDAISLPDPTGKGEAG